MDNTKCERCTSGYGVNAIDKCSPCINATCMNCSLDNTECLDCPLGKGKSPAGGCVTCQIQYCANCQPDSTSCITCDPLKSFSGSICAPCQFPCADCNSSLTINDCTVCVVGYYLDINSMCQLCSTGCINCTS